MEFLSAVQHCLPFKLSNRISTEKSPLRNLSSFGWRRRLDESLADRSTLIANKKFNFNKRVVEPDLRW